MSTLEGEWGGEEGQAGGVLVCEGVRVEGVRMEDVRMEGVGWKV